MSVKDGVGNELAVGDFVLVQLEKPFVIGQVVNLKEGGIDIALAKGQKTPGLIQISCPQTIAFQPGPHPRINVLFKLVNPATQQIMAEIAEKANLGEVATGLHAVPTAATAKPPVEI